MAERWEVVDSPLCADLLSDGTLITFVRNSFFSFRRKVGPKTARQEENPDGVVVDENILQDDFLFEDDSEPSQIVDNFNPSNQYAFDDTIRLKGKDDSSPLVKLRNVEASLSDDASEYDE